MGDELLPKATLALLWFMVSFFILPFLHSSLQPLVEAPFLQETGGTENTCLLTGTLTGA